MITWEEKVRKEHGVNPRPQLEALPEALQDGPEEVARIEDGEGDDHQVERVPHLLGGQDEAGEQVAQDT